MSRYDANEYIKRVGMEHARRTPEGRAALAYLHKKHEKDLLQPSDPRFKQVYGDVEGKLKRDLQRQKENAIEMFLKNKRDKQK